jgi:hypothetical protein
MEKFSSHQEKKSDFPEKKERVRSKSAKNSRRASVKPFYSEAESGFRTPHDLLTEIDFPEKVENELRVLAVTYNMGGKCPTCNDILDDLF